MDGVWEDFISLNPRGRLDVETLAPASEHRASDGHPTDWSTDSAGLEQALATDQWPLPTTDDREGYYGPHHFSYWMSGRRDTRLLLECAARQGVDLRAYLDFGCASGRVLRHVHTALPEAEVLGCDINRNHVDWVSQYLAPQVVAFQNHSIPSLPLADESLDAITAYSVFTHIEVFDTSWLMEFQRVLRPGGIAWVTVQSDHTWQVMGPGWPVYESLLHLPDFEPFIGDRGRLPAPRMVFRYRGDRSYTGHVFYSRDYIRRTWGRIFEVVEEHEEHPDRQDVVILRKRTR